MYIHTFTHIYTHIDIYMCTYTNRTHMPVPWCRALPAQLTAANARWPWHLIRLGRRLEHFFFLHFRKSVYLVCALYMRTRCTHFWKCVPFWYVYCVYGVLVCVLCICVLCIRYMHCVYGYVSCVHALAYVCTVYTHWCICALCIRTRVPVRCVPCIYE